MDGSEETQGRDDKPILKTLKLLLVYQGSATYQEIASLIKGDPRAVLEVLVANKRVLDFENGRVRRLTSDWLFYCGECFRVWTRGTVLRFELHDELREELEKIELPNGRIDVKNTPENRARLIEAGCVPEDEINIDELWKE